MSADWYPDPLGRADLRRHDGARWTHDVVIDGQQTAEPLGFPLPRSAPGTTPIPPPPVPYPVATQAPPTRRPVAQASASGGLLIASGVLGIVTGAVTLIFTAQFLVLASDVGRLTCDVGLPSCGRASFAYLLGFVFLAFGVLYLAAGIGACVRSPWARSLLIVLGAIGVVFQLVILVAGAGVLAILPLLWFGTIAGLALAANPWDLA